MTQSILQLPEGFVSRVIPAEGILRKEKGKGCCYGGVAFNESPVKPGEAQKSS